MTVRQAAEQDIDGIFAMVLELAEYEKLTHLVTGTADDLRGAWTRGEVRLLAGEVEGELAGYALFFPNFSTFLMKQGFWLEDIYVRPVARGKGLGKALLHAVIELGIAEGMGRVEWAVLDWNQLAIDFYEAMGAVVMPDWRICRVVL
jgi:GNAT superfamily N-acetyltransferase